jgi:hypothetical protein
MKIDNFFTELKRRNVIRMAGLYLVGAWLLPQVASTVLPIFGAPDMVGARVRKASDRRLAQGGAGDCRREKVKIDNLWDCHRSLTSDFRHGESVHRRI